MSEEKSTLWTVLGPGQKRGFLLCRCECGTEREIVAGNIRLNLSKSCGCTRGASIARHGQTGTVTYYTWARIKSRCSDESNKSYKDYGGRGITVCKRWADSFEAFLADMGERPSDAHSIDRIDNSKGYWCGKPECSECGPAGRIPNCRWATRGEQSRNTSRTRMETYKGKTQCLKDWATEYGMDYVLFLARLKLGWSFEDALTRPVRGAHGKCEERRRRENGKT